LRKDSPLGAALRGKSIVTARGRYGVEFTRKSGAGIVIPEVVRRDNLEIGRFEVTASQLMQYDLRNGITEPRNDGRHVDSASANRGLANLDRPASGVSLERARDYVAWLSQTTGEVWRLPYEDEVKSLYEHREGENTLDYWAGYAPNPEDTQRLREKAKELSGIAPLLKEVGSFRGQGKEGEEPIYDLGGNVAEWVLTRDGKGKVIGGSADCPAAPGSGCTPAPEYIGFRVVRGAAKPAQ